MIEYRNIIRYDDISFREYLNLNGRSHSSLKNNINGVKEAITITENIRIGSLVDGILTDKKAVDYSDELYPYAKSLAFEIKNFFGDHICVLKSQVSYTGEISCSEFSMTVKGRLDFLLEDIATLDIKITKSKAIDTLIEYMGYENQLWHYSKLAKTPKAYLIIYSIPLKKVIVKSVDVSSNTNFFWENKIIDFGIVEENHVND